MKFFMSASRDTYACVNKNVERHKHCLGIILLYKVSSGLIEFKLGNLVTQVISRQF